MSASPWEWGKDRRGAPRGVDRGHTGAPWELHSLEPREEQASCIKCLKTKVRTSSVISGSRRLSWC